MPRYVDANQRTKEILDATVRVLSEGGFAKLTLATLAKNLGGSVTLVTHYFPNRQALISALLARALDESNAFIASIRGLSDASMRLHAVLEWFLVLDDESLTEERMRVALTAHKNVEPVIGEFFNHLEPVMRRALRAAVNELVPAEELDMTVDILRAWTSGLALATVEHPEVWTPNHQRRVLNEFLRRLQIGTASPAA